MRQLIIAVLVSFLLSPTVWADESVYEPVPEMKHPADNKWSKEKEELGKMLYFDPRLSGSNWISCATCHKRTAPNIIGTKLKINTFKMIVKNGRAGTMMGSFKNKFTEKEIENIYSYLSNSK